MFDRFVFDGICCDEYGIRCVSFESSGKQTYSTQETELEIEKSILGNNFNIISQQYKNPLEYTMQVVNRDYSPISQTQEKVLKKWLCKRNTYHTFSILDKRYADICFFANIHEPKSIWVNNVNGLEFTVSTNSPTAFSDVRNKVYSFEKGSSVTIYIDNDEELPIYPNMTMISQSSGTLKITNQSNPDQRYNTFSIKNVSTGEKIIVDATYPLVESSNIAHNKTIYDDFNKEWFYFIDGYNTISANMPCTIQFDYREYRKVGLV